MSKKTVSITALGDCQELLSILASDVIGKSVFEVKKSIMPENSTKKEIEALEPTLQIIAAVIHAYGIEFSLTVKYSDKDKLNPVLGSVEKQESNTDKDLKKQDEDISEDLKPSPVIINTDDFKKEESSEKNDDDVPDFN